MSAVNSERVVLLTEVDMDTMLAAIEGQGFTVIRLEDGSIPTEEQLGLILSATRDDWQAAQDLKRRQAEAAKWLAEATARAADLIGKYSTHDQQPVGEIYPRMSREDQAEFTHLASLMVNGGPQAKEES